MPPAAFVTDKIMRYFASCDRFDDGEMKWFVGDNQTHDTLCTAADHKNLVRNLKRYMQRRRIDRLTFQWENDSRTQTVTICHK